MASLVNSFSIRFSLVMLIIYGLGNPDFKYTKTKHNIGQLIVEKLSAVGEEVWKKQTKFKTCKLASDLNQTSLLLTSDYMNTSGNGLQAFWQYFKLTSQDVILVLQDDSDQIEGTWKLVKGGGSGGHKGIVDIYKVASGMDIKPDNILRLKIGIRPEMNRQKSQTFVLSPLSQLDETSIETLTEHIQIGISEYPLPERFDKLQTLINSR
jgi:PTH1 family peptidyl-tRNA hydrolase